VICFSTLRAPSTWGNASSTLVRNPLTALIAARPLSSSAWITSSESSVARSAALVGSCSLAITFTIFQEFVVLAFVGRPMRMSLNSSSMRRGGIAAHRSADRQRPRPAGSRMGELHRAELEPPWSAVGARAGRSWGVGVAARIAITLEDGSGRLFLACLMKERGRHAPSRRHARGPARRALRITRSEPERLRPVRAQPRVMRRCGPLVGCLGLADDLANIHADERGRGIRQVAQ